MGSTEAKTREFDEIWTLEKYGIRWAILAAWCSELQAKGIALYPETPRWLESARIKLSSGCYSSCEVGCDLAAVEGALVSLAAGFSPETVDPWLDLLALAMNGRSEDIAKAVEIPAVRVMLSECRSRGCDCAN